MRSLLPIFLLVTNFASGQTDEQQIREARQHHNRAIAQHDTVAIANFWTTDFHVITSRNMEARSSEQNRQFLSREFKTKKVWCMCAHPKQLMFSLNGVWRLKPARGRGSGKNLMAW